MRDIKDFFLKTKGETVLRLPEYTVMATVLSDRALEDKGCVLFLGLFLRKEKYTSRCLTKSSGSKQSWAP